MKLTDIDLNDKTEVAAAHALLAAVLGVSELTITNRIGEISRTATGTVQQLAQAGVIEQPLQDAAVVFGAAPLLGAAISAQIPASTLPNNGGISGAPGAAAFISHAAAANGLPTAGVELDAKGLPWDSRIHASTKSKKKDGTWTALRGLNDEGKVKQIEAELLTQVQGAQLGAIVQAQGATPLPGLAPASAAGNTLPGIAASSQLPVTGAPAVSADPVTFEQLMPRITPATIAGILPATALQQVCGLLGLPSVVALQTNPAYVPHAWAQLKGAYPALQ